MTSKNLTRAIEAYRAGRGREALAALGGPGPWTEYFERETQEVIEAYVDPDGDFELDLGAINDNAIDWDDAEGLADQLRDELDACHERALFATAKEALLALATEDGRWAVPTFGRGDLACLATGPAFADKEHAEAYRTLEMDGCNGTESTYLSVIDREED